MSWRNAEIISRLVPKFYFILTRFDDLVCAMKKRACTIKKKLAQQKRRSSPELVKFVCQQISCSNGTEDKS